jgi:electron transfer flavoprotein alpha subunit
MAALVIAEHDNGSLKASTAHTITAAARCSDEIHVLIAGQDCDAAAAAAAQLAGVSKVLVAEGEQFANGLAENVAEQALALALLTHTSSRQRLPMAKTFCRALQLVSMWVRFPKSPKSSHRILSSVRFMRVMRLRPCSRLMPSR